MRDPLHWMPVRLKLPLLVAGVCLLAFGVGGTIVSTSARDALEAEILRRLDAECRAHAESLDGALTLLTRRAQDFASDGYVRDRLDRLRSAAPGSAAEGLQADLRDHLERNKLPLVAAFRDLAVLDAAGRPQTAVRVAPAAVVVEGGSPGAVDDSPWHSGVLEADAVVDASHLVIAVPVRDLAGAERIGQLLAFVPLSDWFTAARQSPFVGERGTDADGAPHAASAAPAALHLTDRAGRRVAVGGDRTGVSGSARPVFARSLELPINGWQLHSEVDAGRALAPVSGLQSRFLAVGAVLALLSGALLFFPMRFLVAPLQALQRASRRIADGDLEARVSVSSTDEIGALAHSFNSMADALAERAARIAQANAALERSRRELVAERDRLNAVFASMRDALVLVSPAGRPVLHNTAARPLLAALLAQDGRMAGRHRCHAGASGEDDCSACLTDAATAPRSCLVDVAGATWEVHGVPVAAEPGGPPGRLLVARDVTDRIEQDERMIHQERLSALGEVAAVMAHELNNPLAAICMFQQLLANALPVDSPHHEAVDRIGRNAEVCRRTIRELLDYTTGARAEVAEFPLHEAVEGAARFVRPLSKRARVAIELDLVADDPQVVGDEVQVRQLFVNLAMNALQAIGAGGRGGRITMATRVVAEQAVVDVVDDGPGVPDAARPRLFQPFFTTKQRGEGTGLGLVTARRIAELHGGRLELLESRPGRTVFRATFRTVAATVATGGSR